MVTPQNWLTLASYKQLRVRFLDRSSIHLVARLGPGAFETISGHVVQPALLLFENGVPHAEAQTYFAEAGTSTTVQEKAAALRSQWTAAAQRDVKATPDSRIVLPASSSGPLLSTYASSYAGILNGDTARFVRRFWEVPTVGGTWERLQSTVPETMPFGGRESVLRWEKGKGELERYAQDNKDRLHSAHRRGSAAWGKDGVAISQFGSLPATLYSGDLFDSNVAVILAKDAKHLRPLLALLPVRRVPVRGAENRPEDERHERDADEGPLRPRALDEGRRRAVPGRSARAALGRSDPVAVQGRPDGVDAPLQVAVARLLGYRWPEQAPDDLDELADPDGIVLPSGAVGERPGGRAAARARWPRRTATSGASALLDELLAAEGAARRVARGLAARRLLRAALRALPQPPVHLAHLGRPQGRLLRARQLPPPRPRERSSGSPTPTSATGSSASAPASATEAGAEARLAAALELQEQARS